MPDLTPGCLLLHGFTSNPEAMSLLIPRVEALGMPWRTPILRGHGTCAADLIGVRWQDWVEDARVALMDLTSDGRPALIVGLSMGGLLALDLGIEHPSQVLGIVTIAPCLRFVSPMIYLMPILLGALRWFDATPRYTDPSRACHDTSYRKFPVRTLAQLYRYTHVVREKLPRLECPLQIVQSTADKTVKPQSAQRIYDMVASSDRELIWLDRTDHCMLIDCQRDEVAAHVESFLRRQLVRWDLK